MFFEERLRRVGADRMEIAVHRHADTLLALAHTEGARKLHLVTEIVVADKLPELTQQEILELYVDDMEHIPNQTYATDLLSMQLLQTDLIIMPESLLKELDVAVYFPELPETLQDNTDYQIDGKHYGILLNGYSQEEPVYLLLATNSVNLGGILDKGNLEDDAALAVLQYLVKEDGQ